MTLAAEHVVVARNGRRLLDGVSVEVTPGELTCVLGPNGAGKSTLVSVLAGDTRPDVGRVLCHGTRLDAMSDREQARWRGVMAQAQVPVFGFTVADVVAMGWVRDGNERRCRSVVGERLRACGIEHLAGRALHTLSGGEQQRVHFARALVQTWRPPEDSSPRYLLLDEPTASLDLVHQQRLLALALGEARSGLGVLAVLHDLNLAARYADRIALLAEGRLVHCGPPATVLEADGLSRVYGTSIHVEHHRTLDRLVVLT